MGEGPIEAAVERERALEIGRLSRRVEQVVSRGREIGGLQANLKVMEDKLDDMGADMYAIKTAVFGNPLDHEDSGIAGAVRDIRDWLPKASKERHVSMERLYIALLSFIGVLMIVGATLAAALH